LEIVVHQCYRREPVSAAFDTHHHLVCSVLSASCFILVFCRPPTLLPSLPDLCHFRRLSLLARRGHRLCGNVYHMIPVLIWAPSSLVERWLTWASDGADSPFLLYSSFPHLPWIFFSICHPCHPSLLVPVFPIPLFSDLSRSVAHALLPPVLLAPIPFSSSTFDSPPFSRPPSHSIPRLPILVYLCEARQACCSLQGQELGLRQKRATTLIHARAHPSRVSRVRGGIGLRV
jgi:hypothetical protein